MTVRTVVIAVLLAMIVPMAAAQEEYIIRDVVVEGGMTLTVDTVSYYLGLEPEDPLDREAIVDGYRRLWDSGLFEDVRIEIENHGDGEVTLGLGPKPVGPVYVYRPEARKLDLLARFKHFIKGFSRGK